MSTPLFLVSGLDEAAMTTAALGLQVDLPRAVVVRHEVDAVAGTLHRTVSDLTGVLERETLPLEHACASCAVREDVLPTLERLGQLGRWEAIIGQLPVAADALSLARALAWRGVESAVRIGGVVAALHGGCLLADLVEDDLVGERLPGSGHDMRGVAEVLASMIEGADLVTVHGAAAPAALELVRLLARPGVGVSQDWPDLAPEVLLAGLHDLAVTDAWAGEVFEGPSRDAAGAHTWRLDLRSDVPLHPGRLHANIGALGGGRHRSRGCFWVAGRADQIGVWEGAGGQLGIGVNGSWGRSVPFTRLLFVGAVEDDVRGELREAFARSLLTEAEQRARGHRWEATTDGLEPWLGPTVQVA